MRPSLPPLLLLHSVPVLAILPYLCLEETCPLEAWPAAAAALLLVLVAALQPAPLRPLVPLVLPVEPVEPQLLVHLAVSASLPVQVQAHRRPRGRSCPPSRRRQATDPVGRRTAARVYVPLALYAVYPY